MQTETTVVDGGGFFLPAVNWQEHADLLTESLGSVTQTVTETPIEVVPPIIVGVEETWSAELPRPMKFKEWL